MIKLLVADDDDQKNVSRFCDNHFGQKWRVSHDSHDLMIKLLVDFVENKNLWIQWIWWNLGDMVDLVKNIWISRSVLGMTLINSEAAS